MRRIAADSLAGGSVPVGAFVIHDGAAHNCCFHAEVEGEAEVGRDFVAREEFGAGDGRVGRAAEEDDVGIGAAGEGAFADEAEAAGRSGGSEFHNAAQWDFFPERLGHSPDAPFLGAEVQEHACVYGVGSQPVGEREQFVLMVKAGRSTGSARMIRVHLSRRARAACAWRDKFSAS